MSHIQRLPVGDGVPRGDGTAGIGLRQFEAIGSSVGCGVIQLTLRGDIDLGVRDQLRQIVAAHLLVDGARLLLIDLVGVTFLDCCGIGVLMAGRNRAAEVGCGYRVKYGTGIVARILETTGVAPFLEYSLAPAEGGAPAA